MLRRLGLLAMLAALVWPASVAAQDSDNRDDDVLIRINGPMSIGPNDAIDTVIGIDNDVTIAEQATVRDTLLVIDGTATVNGRVETNVVVISGTLNLGPTATVKDVTLISSDLNRDPAATITGDLEERDELINISFGWGAFVFSFLFWLSVSIVVLVAGIIFAAIGARQLVAGAAAMTERAGASILIAFVVWVGLPILAILFFFTVIGIPLGVAIFVFVLPALWFLGYLVAGTRLGLAIVRPSDPVAARGRLILAAVVGLLILQIIGLIPFLGGVIVFFAGLFGSGALLYLVYRNLTGRGVMPIGSGIPAPTAAA
jgi:hypothetical protein